MVAHTGDDLKKRNPRTTAIDPTATADASGTEPTPAPAAPAEVTAGDFLAQYAVEARAAEEARVREQDATARRAQEERDQEIAELQRQAAAGASPPRPAAPATSGQVADASGQVGAAAAEAAPAAAEPQASVARTRNGDPVLERGMGSKEHPSEDVKKWQEELHAKGLYNGPIDGIFGGLTDDATKKYQAQYTPDKVDGVVGALTWAAYKEHKGEPFPGKSEITETPLPGSVETPPGTPLAAQQIVHGTPEQREASMKQLQKDIDAEFERQNHTIDANGTHHYSMAWVASKFTGTPEVPQSIVEAFKQGNDPRIAITDDNGNVIPGKEAVSVFDDKGNLTKDAKDAMIKGAFNGKLEAAGKELEESQKQRDAQAPTTSPRLSDIDLVAQGHSDLRGKLIEDIGTRLREENPDKDKVKIGLSEQAYETLKEKGVLEYGNGQSVDFRVDPKSPLAEQVAKMKAEMQEFAGLISGGKHIQNIDAEKLQKNIVTPLATPVERDSQGR